MKSKLLIFILVILIAIQFVPLDQTNPPIIDGQEIEMPDDVKAIMKKSCYDCHSNETVWPAYSKIAPFSWLISHDVDEGRADINFSEWNTYSDVDKIDIFEEIWEEIEKEDMPLPYYTILHSEAEITPESKKILVDWFREMNIKEPKELKK